MAPAPHALDRTALDAAAAVAPVDEPGVAVGVRAGGSVATACRGVADLGRGAPVSSTTAFCIASLSKPLTALATLVAAEDGALSLDAPISAYIDAWRDPAAPTVHHLLTHTGGVPNYVTSGALEILAALPNVTLADVIASFATEPLEFPAGARYGYSNSGYRLLEGALERTLGAPFAATLADRVLVPLGMRDAQVLSGDEAPGRLATGCERVEGSWSPARLPSWDLAGAAGAVACTLDDWLALDEGLFARGTFGEAVLAAMIEPVRLTNGRVEAIGAGWVLSAYRGEPVVTFAGGIVGYSAIYCRLPRLHASVTILANRGGSDLAPTARTVVDELLDGELLDGEMRAPTSLRSGAPSPAWAASYCDTLREVSLDHDAEGWRLEDGRSTTHLVPDGPTRLRDRDDDARKVRLHDERPRAITVSWPFSWFTGYAA